LIFLAQIQLREYQQMYRLDKESRTIAQGGGGKAWKDANGKKHSSESTNMNPISIFQN
jgi:hypothetical protein